MAPCEVTFASSADGSMPRSSTTALYLPRHIEYGWYSSALFSVELKEYRRRTGGRGVGGWLVHYT